MKIYVGYNDNGYYGLSEVQVAFTMLEDILKWFDEDRNGRDYSEVELNDGRPGSETQTQPETKA